MRNLKFLAAAALTFTAVASADTVDVYGAFIGPGQTFNVTEYGNTENVIAGQIGITISNSSGLNLDGSWISYCTEISQNIQIGGGAQTYTISSVADLPTPGAGMGSARAEAIARMYFAAGGAQYSNDNDFCGAFALAIWKVSDDFDGTLASLGLGSGNLVLNSSINVATQNYLDFLFGAAANLNGPQASILGLGNGSYQDLIIEVPGPGALALLGAAGLVASRRRRA
ncbi:MAG: hypothetical protein U0636_12995 [Phycisphaerales bacterium]